MIHPKIENPGETHGARPPIAFVILNWKNWRRTFSCIEALLPQLSSKDHIFLNDNGSNDSSYENLKQQFGNQNNITLTQLKENLGFAGGCNLGIEMALQNSDYPFIFLLNNDASLTPGSIEKLLHLISKTNAPMVCAKGIEHPSNRVYFTGYKLPQALCGNYQSYPIDTRLNAYPTDYCEGSALLLNAQFAKRLILERGSVFDPQLFMYCEDVELGLICKKKNLKIYVSNEATVLHEVSSSGGGPGNPLAYYYITRNRPYLAKKFFSAKKYRIFQLYYYSTRIPLALRARLRSKAQSSALISGLMDSVRGKTGRWSQHPQ